MRTPTLPIEPDRDERSLREPAFREWQLSLRTDQVRYVALLTAVLYLVYAGTEFRLVSANLLSQLQTLRALAISIALTLIALMSFRRGLLSFKRILLAVAPVAAVAGNLFLSTQGQPLVHYAPEIYLAVMWTFSVSGLTLREAIPSALASSILVLGHLALFHPVEVIPSLHLLWLASAFAFGLLSAFMLERRDRRLFSQRQQLERLATFDDLTGLWNQRQIRERLAGEVERSKRTGAALSIIMLDIDHFKRVNDRYGHVVGDVVLADLAAVLRDHVRTVDMVGRIGGEEFLVVLPETDAAQAALVAEKLRAEMQQHDFPTEDSQSASFGVARHAPGDSLDDLLQRADQALYSAKRAGRNRVVTAGE